MPESTPPRGRPRSDAAHAAILAAAFDLLAERGYAGMGIEPVAARAGVSRATVYRRWPDRAALAVDAFFAATRAELAFPDTGSGRGDFRAQIRHLAGVLRGPAGAAMVGMVAGARADPALARAVRDRWVLPRREWGRARLSAAKAAGECPPGLDVDAALDALYGPLYARLLFGLDIPAEHQVEAYLDIVLRGVFGQTREA